MSIVLSKTGEEKIKRRNNFIPLFFKGTYQYTIRHRKRLL